MGLSSYIDEIIKQNDATIVSDVPIEDILIDLRRANILSTDEINRLRQGQHHEDVGFEFLEILKSRNDEDFFQFCNILIDSEIAKVRNLGLNLELAANKIQAHGQSQTNIYESVVNIQVLQGFVGDIAVWLGRLFRFFMNWTSNGSKEMLLRDLPPTPGSSYILREKFNNIICHQLKQINRSRSGGRILVYGMPGCGKTVAVCQSVRQVIMQDNCFQSYGCYWIKIGNISDEELLYILRGLAHNLGIADTELIISLAEINAKINRFLQDKHQSEMLFVFDDIWKEEHLKYVTFAETSICISRFNLAGNGYSFSRIAAVENLTLDEAIQLIQTRRHNDIKYILQNNKLVKDVIERCGGLPLAIATIASLNLKSNKDWQDVLNVIILPKPQSTKHDYRKNLFQIFELSIKQLSPEVRELFRFLGVFKAAKISLQSIASLWQVHPSQAKPILKELHSKSLLTFVDGNSPYSVLHDLIIEHLQRPINHQQSFQQYSVILNQKLIDGYRKQCQGKWFLHPHDNYYYQYLIYHAIQTQDHNTIQHIMSDFKWMNIKLQVDNTIYNLCVDMEKAIDYLRTNRIENWQRYQQLVQLLKRYESNLSIKSIDLVQALLTLADDIDWIKERALELAKETKYDIEYWKIAIINCDNIEETVEQLKSKRMGKTPFDDCIAVSNPRYGNLRIIGIENNGNQDGRIVIMDYETSKIVHQLTQRHIFIRNVAISPDGRIIAFKSSEYVHSFFLWNWLKRRRLWKVYNIDNNEELNFIESKLQKLQDQGFDELKFCPIVHNNDTILLTLSVNRKQVKVWKIADNRIHYVNKQISVDYKIESIQWIQNGSQILLWWRKYDYTDDNFEPLYWSHWMNECQIEIWDLQSWQCLKSILVPACIISRNHAYLPAVNVDDRRSLTSVKYISCSTECLVLSYQSKGGLLMLENYDLKLWLDEHLLKNNFHPFPSCICHFLGHDIAVSCDQQFIFMGRKFEKIYAFKVANGQFQSYIKLKSSHLSLKAMFTLEHNRLLVYEGNNSLYEYVVQEHGLQWNILKNDGTDDEHDSNNEEDDNNDDDVEILDSGYGYISNNPVGVQLIKKENTYNLKVCELQQQSSPSLFCYTSDEQLEACYIPDDLLSVIAIGINHKSVVITQWQLRNQISPNDEKQQHKILWQYKLPDNVWTITVKELRYRKTDDTLIIVIQEHINNQDMEYAARLTLLTITLRNGQTNIYRDSDFYEYDCKCIYMNDYFIIARCTDASNLVKCYRIGKDTIQMQRIIPQEYDPSSAGLACKITLPIDQLTDHFQIKSSPLYTDKDELVEYWGEKDGNLFILDENGKVRMKGDDHSSKTIVFEISIVMKQNLWCDKHWIGFNHITKNVHIYEAATMQLLQILPFPYFNITGIKWNKEQSSFIAFDNNGRQNCVIERVKFDTINKRIT